MVGMKKSIKSLFLATLIGATCIAPLAACSDTTPFTVSTQEIVLVLDDDAYKSASIEATGSKISYRSADTSVATVSDNTVTAVGLGFTEVTVSHGKDDAEQATVKVYVVQKNDALDVTDKTQVNYYGRSFVKEGAMCFYNTAAGFEVSFIGTQLSVDLNVDLNKQMEGMGALRVFIDGVRQEEAITFPHQTTDGYIQYDGVVLAKDLPLGVHTVKVVKMTEQGLMTAELRGAHTDGTFLTPKAKPELKIEFYGDSITGGYGNLGDNSGYMWDEDSSYTYATLTADELGAEASLISYSGIPAALPVQHSHLKMMDVFDKVYLDAPASMEKYDFTEFDADIVVINLGTNDCSSPDAKYDGIMQEGCKKMIEGIHAVRPDAYIVWIYGMMGKSGTGKYIEQEIIRAVDECEAAGIKVLYQEIRANGLGVGGHPDKEGHEAAAKTLVELLRNRVL